MFVVVLTSNIVFLVHLMQISIFVYMQNAEL